MKTKIKKLCATIITVILSVICAGCGDLSALKTKYIAELDAYYQEIEAMNLEYSTIFIQAELEKGKENINAMKKSATMSAEVNATKQRMQEFILSQEELEEIKQNNYSYMDDTVQLLYYLGKTSKGTQAFLFNTVRLSADLPITTIESYTFYFPKRDIVVLHDGMTIILTAAYAYEIIDAQELDEIYEKYVIIASNDPLYGDFIKD